MVSYAPILPIVRLHLKKTKKNKTQQHHANSQLQFTLNCPAYPDMLTFVEPASCMIWKARICVNLLAIHFAVVLSFLHLMEVRAVVASETCDGQDLVLRSCSNLMTEIKFVFRSSTQGKQRVWGFPHTAAAKVKLPSTNSDLVRYTRMK